MAHNLKTQPLVSVIIPAYNAAAFVKDALDSVKAQTYLNWEVVLIDDGSTDDTKSIVQASGIPTKQLQYLSSKNNGPGAARNRGIKAAKGEIIAFLDADDVWAPNKLEAQVNKLGEGIDLVFSGGHFFGIENPPPFVTAKGPYSGAEMFKVLYLHNRIPILSVATTKKALQKGGYFKEAGLLSRKCEDYDLWLRMAQAGCSFYGLPEDLVGYRLHPASSTNQDLIMSQGDLEAIEQFKDSVDPTDRRQRLRELYNRLAAAAARSGDTGLAKKYLDRLADFEPAALNRPKRLALACFGRYYSAFYHRVLKRIPGASG